MNVWNKRLKLLEMTALRNQAAIYPNNDDGFIEALGLKPNDYAIANNSFDYLRAIEDTAPADWSNY